jgi:hypothetical protein
LNSLAHTIFVKVVLEKTACVAQMLPYFIFIKFFERPFLNLMFGSGKNLIRCVWKVLLSKQINSEIVIFISSWSVNDIFYLFWKLFHFDFQGLSDKPIFILMVKIYIFKEWKMSDLWDFP